MVRRRPPARVGVRHHEPGGARDARDRRPARERTAGGPPCARGKGPPVPACDRGAGGCHDLSRAVPGAWPARRPSRSAKLPPCSLARVCSCCRTRAGAMPTTRTPRCSTRSDGSARPLARSPGKPTDRCRGTPASPDSASVRRGEERVSAEPASAGLSPPVGRGVRRAVARLSIRSRYRRRAARPAGVRR